MEGLSDPLVVDGHITVGDRPGMGVNFIVEQARSYLAVEDTAFFD